MTAHTSIGVLLGGLGLCGAACLLAPGALALTAGGVIGAAGVALTPNIAADLFSRLADWSGKKLRDRGAAAKNHDLRELLALSIENVLDEVIRLKPGGSEGVTLLRAYRDAIRARLADTALDPRFKGTWEQTVPHYFKARLDEFSMVRAMTPDIWKTFLNQSDGATLTPNQQTALNAAADALHTRLPTHMVGAYRDALEHHPTIFVAVQTALLQELWTAVSRTESKTDAMRAAQAETLARLDAISADIRRNFPEEFAEAIVELRVLLGTVEWLVRGMQADLRAMKTTAEDTNRRVQEFGKRLDTLDPSKIAAAIFRELVTIKGGATADAQITALLQTVRDRVPSPPEAGASTQTPESPTVRTLVDQLALLAKTEKSHNLRFFSIQRVLRAKFEAAGVDVRAMHAQVKHFHLEFSTSNDRSVSSAIMSVEQLRKLRRDLRLVAEDMAQFPQDLLERAAKHGVYYYQFHAGILEIPLLDRLLPDALAVADPDQRRQAIADALLNPVHEAYGLENIARMLRTTSQVLSLSREAFSDGFSQHGSLHTPVDLSSTTALLAFSCYRADHLNKDGGSEGHPGVLVVRCTRDHGASILGRLVARKTELSRLSLHVDASGRPLIYARDPDYAYEWDLSETTPRRCWAPPDADTHAAAPSHVLDVIPCTHAGQPSVVIRTTREFLVDGPDGPRTLTHNRRPASSSRLIADPTRGGFIEVATAREYGAQRGSEPQIYRVGRPDNADPTFQINVRCIFSKTHSTPGNHASLERAPDDRGTPVYVLDACETLTGVNHWSLHTIDGAPVLCLHAQSGDEPAVRDHARWLFLIDLSGPAPRLLTQPIRTNVPILESTFVRCASGLLAFASLLSSRDFPHKVIGFRLNEASRAWEHHGLWAPTDWSRFSMEDALDIHALPNGDHADVFYLTRRHPTRAGLSAIHYALFHLSSADQDAQQLMELPENIKECSSSLVALPAKQS